MKLEEFLDKDADHQRWALYGIVTSHLADPNAHHPEGRLRFEVKDKGPVVAILAAIVIIVEALGYV